MFKKVHLFPAEVTMRLVILESPYAGDVELNVAYARDCLHDCLMRGKRRTLAIFFTPSPEFLTITCPKRGSSALKRASHGAPRPTQQWYIRTWVFPREWNTALKTPKRKAVQSSTGA